jgi:hypothetical protein
VLNFQSTLDIPTVTPDTSSTTETALVVREQVTFRRPETRVTDVGKDSATWSWEDLRNYVVRSIEQAHGPFPREAPKEASIFKSFADRWGPLAGPIATFVFGELGGMWRGAPVRIQRFCKGSDPYFAEPIAARLRG